MHSIPFRQLGIDVDGDCHGTEGPWVFDARRMIVTSTLPRTGMRPAGDPFPTVCRLPASYTPQVVDGYLLAAAPDLLAVCEELLPELACRCDEGFTSRGRHKPNALCHYHDDLQAVIAKARGQG